MFGPGRNSAWGAEPLLDAAVASDGEGEEEAAASGARPSEAALAAPPGAAAAAAPGAGVGRGEPAVDLREQDAAALQTALASAARSLVSAALAAATAGVSAAGSAVAAPADKSPPASAPIPTSYAASAPPPVEAPPSAWRFPAFMQPRRGGGAPLAAPLLPTTGDALPTHPGGTRLARARAAVARFIPASVERSILAYAAVVCICSATGLACVPAFPLFWRCAGVLPLLSILLIATSFAAAYVISLLPDASNLVPALLLTTGLAVFYFLRLAIADKRRISGPRSLNDLLFGLLSLAELTVLALGVRRRQRLRDGRRGGLV